jgi:hypothetical protein
VVRSYVMMMMMMTMVRKCCNLVDKMKTNSIGGLDTLGGCV